MNSKKTSEKPHYPKGGALTRLGEVISDGLLTLVKWNFLFLITCIPVITIGPSLAALGFCTTALVKDDRPQESSAKLYFQAFRASFLRALPLGIFTLFITFIFGLGFLLYFHMIPENAMYIPLASFSLLVLLLFWGIMIHVFPLLFDFDATDWDSKQIFLKEKPLRKLFSEAAYRALERMKKTTFALIFSIIFISGQLLIFPTTLPLTVTIGFAFPALSGAFAHTDPEF